MLLQLCAPLTAVFNVLPGSIADGFIWSILTIGVFISYKILNIADMSVEGTFALGGTVTAALLTIGVPVSVAMIVGAIGGFIAGVFTAILHTKLKIPAILSGILTMFILYSINIHVLGNKASLALLGRITLMRKLAEATSPMVANLIVGGIFALLTVGASYWFFGTKYGSSVRATGCNPEMARAQGINTDGRIILTLGISNALAALSGSLLAQSNNNVTANMGSGAIVIGLAGVVLGEAFVKEKWPFAFRLIGVLAGSVLYRIVIALALQLLNGFLTADDMKLISAVLIIAVLAEK